MGPQSGPYARFMHDLSSLIDAVVPDAVALRREIHAHPELGFEETQTARRVVDQLSPLGNLDIQTGVAGTGVVAVLNRNKSGPCVGLRADMDALPIQEQSDTAHASTVAGKMHACGHDGHTACLVGAAKVLSQVADTLPGKVKFIFQPAEEGGGGGRLMCEQGVLDRPKVDAVFAMHGWPMLEMGRVGIREGPFMASGDFWDVTIHGKAGHAAYPHRAVDPIVAASHVVLALQTLAARETNPLDALVVTVARLTAGSANNVIPQTAELQGTIRSLSPAVREQAVARFRQIVETTTAAFGTRAEIHFGSGYPVLYNEERSAALVGAAAAAVVGQDALATDVPPSMGAEDFAFYLERTAGALWRLGLGQGCPERRPGLHQPHFDFPDEAVPIAVRMHCEITIRCLRSLA